MASCNFSTEGTTKCTRRLKLHVCNVLLDGIKNSLRTMLGVLVVKMNIEMSLLGIMSRDDRIFLDSASSSNFKCFHSIEIRASKLDLSRSY
jgi:hypothetical protein